MLSVTAWRPSDRLQLPGSRGRRSLKRLCLDRGLTAAQRDVLPVLRAGERPVAAALIGTDVEFLRRETGPAAYVRFEQQDRGEQI